jgi:hypothetical protein
MSRRRETEESTPISTLYTGGAPSDPSMPTPPLATNDEYTPLSAGPAETAIETGSLLYRFERDSEKFAVFETPNETFVGRYTAANSETAYYRITPSVKIANAAVIWMDAGFSLAAFDGAAGKQLLREFSQSQSRTPFE